MSMMVMTISSYLNVKCVKTYIWWVMSRRRDGVGLERQKFFFLYTGHWISEFLRDRGGDGSDKSTTFALHNL